MSDTYFVSRSTFPRLSAIYTDDATFGQYCLTDQECGALFSRSREEKVYNPKTGEHEKIDAAIILDMAEPGQPARLIKCDPSRRVVARIVEKGLTAKRQAEEVALRKSQLLKAGRRIRTAYNVDIDTREAELSAPKYDPETDPMGEFLVDELLNPESPLALAIANA